MGIIDQTFLLGLNDEQFAPKISKSTKYKHWISREDVKRCIDCEKLHGKIWLQTEHPTPKPPLHPFCRCVIEIMEAIKAGTATINGLDGADAKLKFNTKLPNCYISKYEALQKGWSMGKSPSNFCPNKMIFGGNYKNRNGHLPMIPGRIWYEADINYKTGKRNTQRILWSNDGLIFVTYNHYETFFEII